MEALLLANTVESTAKLILELPVPYLFRGAKPLKYDYSSIELLASCDRIFLTCLGKNM